MLRLAVCDDEERERKRLAEMLAEYGKDHPMKEPDFYGGGEALLLSGKKYDVILLDIDMEGLNGIETAERIRQQDKKVKLIYITNYSDYTIFAFAVHAFAYLLKPVKKEELFAQLTESCEYGLPRREEELELATKEGILHIRPSRILMFEYLGREVLLHTTERVYHLKRKITELAVEFQEYDFVMPHKSFVVNLYAVQSIKGYDILLTNGSVVPLSQKKSVEFRKALNEYFARGGG